jgi:hypothetical protein
VQPTPPSSGPPRRGGATAYTALQSWFFGPIDPECVPAI